MPPVRLICCQLMAFCVVVLSMAWLNVICTSVLVVMFVAPLLGEVGGMTCGELIVPLPLSVWNVACAAAARRTPPLACAPVVTVT